MLRNIAASICVGFATSALWVYVIFPKIMH